MLKPQQLQSDAAPRTYVEDYDVELRFPEDYTYTLSFRHISDVFASCETFAELVSSKKFIYLDGHVVINSDKYIRKEHGIAMGLTEYARHHMAECCLDFKRVYAEFDYSYDGSIYVWHADTEGLNFRKACLTFVRHLNEIGVHLIFENNNIDTRTAFSEMLLTVLAAFAQEESRSISLNTTWSIRKRYEEGKSRWTRLYGYEKNENGEYQIVPEQASVVKKIFTLYEHGEPIEKIMKHLEDEGVPTPENCETWSMCTVRLMLQNERYCGDILLQKTICESHITHRQIKNDTTEVPSYYIENHHQAIISREQFQRCKRIFELRRTPHPDMPGKYNNQYPLGDKLVCPICGSRLFKRSIKIQRPGSGWSCEIGEHACRQFIIRASFVEQALLNAYHTLDAGIVETKLSSPKFGTEAEIMLKYKREYPRMKKVDYWWVDDLVDHIEFGKHLRTTKELIALEVKGTPDPDDRSMKVYWKCGLVTTVQTIGDSIGCEVNAGNAGQIQRVVITKDDIVVEKT